MKKQKVICFGEILWDNLKEGRRLGGAPLNVCYHLSQMGISTSIITQIGKDKDGNDILETLDELGVDIETVIRTDKHPTSTVEVLLGKNNEVHYEIMEDVAWDHIEYSHDLGKLVNESLILVFGSLVTRSETSRKTLFKLIEKSQYRVFDVNLRAPFYHKELILSLLRVTHLLKLNQDELSIISKWLGGNQKNDQDEIGLIQEKFPNLTEILLTQGHKGAMLVTNDIWTKVPSCNVKVKDTVGSGDSFLAAYIAAKIKKVSANTALKEASLLSGFIATHNGACPVYNLTDFNNFKNDYQSELETKIIK